MEVQRPDGQVYQVGHIDFPPFTEFDAKAGFDGGIQSAAQSSGGTITSQQDTTVNGNPARDFTWNGKLLGHSITGRGRFISAGRRFYQILWIAPAASTPGDVDRFFNSFQITYSASSQADVTPPQASSDSNAPSNSIASITLDQKKEIFREWMEAKQSVDTKLFPSGEGLDPVVRDLVNKKKDETRQVLRLKLVDRYNITVEQLIQIEAEGLANRWPGSP
jgi:hypothetical protein